MIGDSPHLEVIGLRLTCPVDRLFVDLVLSPRYSYTTHGNPSRSKSIQFHNAMPTIIPVRCHRPELSRNGKTELAGHWWDNSSCVRRRLYFLLVYTAGRADVVLSWTEATDEGQLYSTQQRKRRPATTNRR